MKITDAAVAAAHLSASCAVEVKTLEFDTVCEYGIEYRVRTSIGTYSIHTDEDSAGGRMFCCFHLTDEADFTVYDEEIYSGYGGDDEAKAAAQADFERRVRDCIDAKMDDVSHAGFEPYMEIVEFFDKDNTAGSFLNEDGEGGFLGAIFRMSREVEYLRSTKPVDVAAVRRQAFEEAVHSIVILKRTFSSDEYAENQPMGSFSEIFACDEILRAIRAISDEPAQDEQWRDMNSAPSDTVVLMAWKDTYQGIWEYEAGIYHSTKGGWRHGSATHWMPLPAAPTSEVGQ